MINCRKFLATNGRGEAYKALNYDITILKEKFEDTKTVIRNLKSIMQRSKGQKTKRQTMIHKTLHRKQNILNIEQHEPTKNRE